MLQKDLLNKQNTEAAAPRDYAAERQALITEYKALMKQKGSQLAQAEIWMQLTALAAAEKGLPAAKTEIGGYLSSAHALLIAPEVPHDAAYGDACRRYAPVFEQYGRTEAAMALRRNAALL